MCLAAPARVLSISGQTAVVDYDGVQTSARLETLGEPVRPGDFVLVHAGFAIQRLSPEDGEETLRLFDELARSVTAHGAPEPHTAHGAQSSQSQSVTRQGSSARQGGHGAQPSQPQSVTGQGSPARQGGHGAQPSQPQSVTGQESPARQGGHGR